MSSESGFVQLATEPCFGRKVGGLIGLLVGDALGVPYEFTAPGNIPRRADIEMRPPGNFRPARPGVPAGTWSDDGAQALCLLASLELLPAPAHIECEASSLS